MNTVFLSLGSNLGDRESNLNKAVASLQGILEGLEQAPLYETSPQDFSEQPDFLNTVLRGHTSLSPPGLLEHIMDIEKQIGRRRKGVRAKGPRSIDIDILLWEKLVAAWYFKGHNLTIPHPAMHKRRFVLIPLVQLDAFLKDPIDGETYYSKAEKLTDQKVELYRGD